MNNTSIQIILLFLKNLCVYRGVIFKTLKKLAEADKTAKAENITVIEKKNCRYEWLSFRQISN